MPCHAREEERKKPLIVLSSRGGYGIEEVGRESVSTEHGRKTVIFQPIYFLAGVGGAFTLLDNQARPSSRPSPVVAQLGTTYQTLSLSLLS